MVCCDGFVHYSPICKIPFINFLFVERLRKLHKSTLANMAARRSFASLNSKDWKKSTCMFGCEPSSQCWGCSM